MSRILFAAAVTVPELPRVRFIKRLPPDSAKPFEDVTTQVALVNIVSLDDTETALALERFDSQKKLVWSTRHQSVEEARWQAEFEYDVSAEAWQTPPASTGDAPVQN